MSCLFTYKFTGLLFLTTEGMKKDKVKIPQRNEMLAFYCNVLGFIRKNEKQIKKQRIISK